MPAGGRRLIRSHRGPLARRIGARTARATSALAAAAICALLLAWPHPAAAEGSLRGNLPRAGGAVVVWSGGPLADFVSAARDRGCDPRTIWHLREADGTPATRSAFYLPGAPAHVNADWHARVGDPVQEGPLYVHCTPAPPAGTSPLETGQIVSLYGYPGIERMGLLGAYTPEAAADEAWRRAGEYDGLNGDRDVVAAFQPIAIVAQPAPGADGDYIRRMPAATLEPYIETARRREMLVILDLQLGWADPLAEVRRLERYLLEPFVHVAIDPEYMTEAKGDPPGSAIGGITAASVNAIQAYLAALVRDHDLPPKLLVVHQFREDMIERPAGGRFADHPEVDVLIDMDGFGPRLGKLSKYDRFARSTYAERAGLKLFVDHDINLLTPADVQSLDAPPDLVIYQ